MKEHNYYFIEHIHRQCISMLLSVIFSFYITLILGSYSVLLCAVISAQIWLSLLVYHYLHLGYDQSARERGAFGEFLIGMLPAQGIQLLFYMGLYRLFVYFYEHRIFESLPIHRLAANTPVLGFAFVLTDTDVLALTEYEDEMRVTLPAHLFGWILLIFMIALIVSVSVSYLCYRRGIFLREREREELRYGVQRLKRGSFAKRFRFFPLVNILPLFPYIYKHLFRVEYKLGDAVLPLILFALAKMVLDIGASFAIWCLNTVWMYYLMHLLSLYLWGILISSVVLREEKERSEHNL